MKQEARTEEQLPIAIICFIELLDVPKKNIDTGSDVIYSFAGVVQWSFA